MYVCAPYLFIYFHGHSGLATGARCAYADFRRRGRAERLARPGRHGRVHRQGDLGRPQRSPAELQRLLKPFGTKISWHIWKRLPDISTPWKRSTQSTIHISFFQSIKFRSFVLLKKRILYDRFARRYIGTSAPLRKASCSALTWQPAAWTYRKWTGFYSTIRRARPRTMCIESVERRASESKELRYSFCYLRRLRTWPYWRHMG